MQQLLQNKEIALSTDKDCKLIIEEDVNEKVYIGNRENNSILRFMSFLIQLCFLPWNFLL